LLESLFSLQNHFESFFKDTSSKRWKQLRNSNGLEATDEIINHCNFDELVLAQFFGGQFKRAEK
jgi:hypothetical protein